MSDTKKHRPINIFYSYAHEDNANRKKLSKYLAPLRNEEKIREWYDDDIIPGHDFGNAINENLYTADIIILIISIDFLNSEYCWKKEMPEALKLYREGKASVIPVMIRPISIQIGHTPFGNLKILPKDGKPITKWGNREDAWVDVSEGIHITVDDLYAKPLKSESAKVALKEKLVNEAKDKKAEVNIPPVAKKGLYRIIYDCNFKTESVIPKKVIRKEGEPPMGDLVANAVYDNLGMVYDFFQKMYKRNSVDGKGLPLTANIHYGKKFENAFWNGSEFCIGDGGQTLKNLFEIDIIANEFSVGVFQYSANLEYWGETGTVLRSCGHVFASLAKQYSNNENVQQASWLIGERSLAGKGITRGIFSLSDPGTAYFNNPFLGDDPGAGHISDIKKGKSKAELQDYTYINAGICDRAFYLAAVMVGGFAWEKTGLVWYKTICGGTLSSKCTIKQFAAATVQTAAKEFGKNSMPALAIHRGWDIVGVDTPIM